MSNKNKIIPTIVFLLAAYNLCFAKEKTAKKILFVRDRNIWVYDITSKKEQEFIKDADNPVCSPDGKQIAFTRNYNIWILDIAANRETKITEFDPSPKKEIEKLDWSTHENYIAFEHNESYELQSKSGKHLVAWPDGEFEIKNRSLQLTSIWLVKKGEPAKKFIGPGLFGSAPVGIQLSPVESPAWSPDGKVIAFSRNGDLWIAEAETLDDKYEQRLLPVAYLANHNGASPSSMGVSKISWSPDGKTLVFSISRMGGSGEGGLRIVNSDGSNLKKLSSNGYEYWPIFLGKSSLVYSDWANIRTINIDGKNNRELIHNAVKPCLCKE